MFRMFLPEPGKGPETRPRCHWVTERLGMVTEDADPEVVDPRSLASVMNGLLVLCCGPGATTQRSS